MALSARLDLALRSGLQMPPEGPVVVRDPPLDWQPGALRDQRIQVISGDWRVHAALNDSHISVSRSVAGPAAASIVHLHRAKDATQDSFARAMAQTAGPVIVDGQKTEGIESLLRAVRARIGPVETVAKAHGKLFWLDGQPGLFDDWFCEPREVRDGFITAPGVFSADGPDAGSVLLGQALPTTLPGRVADLGAGWGFLAPAILRSAALTSLDLVEVDARALRCAKRNVTDPRARFHWHDATAWKAPAPLDCVVMNPPFHTHRSAEPELGRAFIRAAARNLRPDGQLWLVANRHLPYETALSEAFTLVRPIGNEARFKIFHAARPKRRSR